MPWKSLVLTKYGWFSTESALVLKVLSLLRCPLREELQHFFRMSCPFKITWTNSTGFGRGIWQHCNVCLYTWCQIGFYNAHIRFLREKIVSVLLDTTTKNDKFSKFCYKTKILTVFCQNRSVLKNKSTDETKSEQELWLF